MGTVFSDLLVTFCCLLVWETLYKQSWFYTQCLRLLGFSERDLMGIQEVYVFYVQSCIC